MGKHHKTILTPNRRLSATLHQLHQQQKVNQGLKCWQTPDILPLSSWIERLWNEYSSHTFDHTPYLLNQLQEQFLWQEIISQSKEGGLLLQVNETASLAQSAWSLLKQWRIDFNDSIFNVTSDYIHFQHWACVFQQQCKTNRWLDNPSLMDNIAQLIANKKLACADEIELIGFTEISPQLKSLLSHLQQNNCQVTYSSSVTAEPTGQRIHSRISFTDTESEIFALARWAKQLGQEQPQARIGCVIPNLDNLRERVVQVFSQVFAEPGFLSYDKTGHREIPQQSFQPFNISAGKPLSHYPVIEAALTLLNLYKHSWSLEDFSFLLATPFMGEAEKERVPRAQLDSLLRQQNVSEVFFNQSIYGKCLKLETRIKTYIAKYSLYQGKHSYHEWITIFIEQLNLLGWPGERSLNSEEYQAVQCWLDLLIKYSSLDQVSTPVSIENALHQLQCLAKSIIFQPQTPSSNIQVLGILEAAGSPFDYLWVAGLDDVSWPPKPNPNPFIPKSLQRELNMPHATANRELEFCQTIMQQFMQAGANVIFSHALKNEEIDLQPSALIQNLDEVTVKEIPLSSFLAPWEQIYQSQQVEFITDSQGPALTGEKMISGGVNIIKKQALCPFKAFSEHRLCAKELETPLPGLRAKERGNIVHKIMELIWNELRDHQHLIDKTPTELDDIITNAILLTLQSQSNTRNHQVQYTALEKQRLKVLIHRWLQIEKQRPPFSVAYNESKIEIKLGSLTLNCKIDRIDELNDGSYLIIDYKTGKQNNINVWFGDRPEDPQLPLYALINAKKTAAIAYAQINSHELKLIGAGDSDVKINGIKNINELKKTKAESWQDQLTIWRDIFTRLSAEFTKGTATVSPKDGSKTCEWCSLQPFCRIYEEHAHDA